MGATGAALGGVSGFGEGQGGEDRVSKAIMGAALGGGLGGVIPVAGAAVGRLMQTPWGVKLGENVIAPALRTVASVFGQSTPIRGVSAAAADGGNLPPGGLQGLADRLSNPAEGGMVVQIANALQKARMSPERAQGALTRLGEGGMLADIDPQLFALARGVHTMDGETRTLAKPALETRERDYPRLMTQAFEGDAPGTPSTFKLRGQDQGFDQNARAVGLRAYQGDMVDAGMKQTPELMALYENPFVDQALKAVMDVEKKARIGRPNAQPSSPIEILHKVKQAIWDMGFDGPTARPGPNMSYYRDLGTDFVDKLKAANPALAKADVAYSQAKSLPEFFDSGRALLQTEKGAGALTTGQAALEDMLPGADVQQRVAARAGMINAAREQARDPIGAVALAKQVDRNRFTQGKLATAFDAPHAAEIERAANAVKTFRETQGGILGGSQTADKAFDAAAVSGGLPSVGGSPIEAVARALTWLHQKTGPNEAVRNAIGRATLNADSNENRRILELVADALRQRSRGAPVTTIASEIGSQGSP